VAGRARVVVTDFIGEPLEDELKILGDVADVAALNAGCEDDLIGQIEDADAMMGGGGAGGGNSEEAVLHLYNHLAESGRHLMLTAKLPPARWGIGLKDLAS